MGPQSIHPGDFPILTVPPADSQSTVWPKFRWQRHAMDIMGDLGCMVGSQGKV